MVREGGLNRNKGSKESRRSVPNKENILRSHLYQRYTWNEMEIIEHIFWGENGTSVFSFLKVKGRKNGWDTRKRLKESGKKRFIQEFCVQEAGQCSKSHFSSLLFSHLSLPSSPSLVNDSSIDDHLNTNILAPSPRTFQRGKKNKYKERTTLCKERRGRDRCPPASNAECVPFFFPFPKRRTFFMSSSLILLLSFLGPRERKVVGKVQRNFSTRFIPLTQNRWT